MNVVPFKRSGRATDAEWAGVQSALDAAADWTDPDTDTDEVPDLYEGLPAEQAPETPAGVATELPPAGARPPMLPP